MTKKLIQLFIESSERFLESERSLILSGVSERCLCGAFMLILRQVIDQSIFSAYFTDIEYNRNFDGKIKTMINDNMEVTNITCDLIVHSRGTIPELDNLIAIEMKRDDHHDTEKDKDRIRLRALTKPKNDSQTYSAEGEVFPENVCGYKIGVFYEISITKRQVNIEYYLNGLFSGKYLKDF